MRRTFFVIHLWVGLTLGLVAVVIGLSGSLLVFRPELDDSLAPGLHQASGPTRFSLQAMLNVATAHVGKDKITALDLPREPGDSVMFWTKSHGHVFVDPATGEILGSETEDGSLMGWLFKLHTELLSGDGGHTFVGIVGIGLFVLSVSGLVVWWPRGRQKLRDHLTVKRGSGVKRLTFDLHRAWGFYACGLLGMVSLMGIGLVFPDSYKLVVERITGTRTAGKPKVSTGVCASLPLDPLVAAVQRALPEGQLTRITLPTKAGTPLSVRKRLPTEWHPNGMSAVYVDPCDARILRIERDDQATPAQRAVNMRYPLHIGRWGGTLSRCLQVLVGLSPTILAVTGLMMWRRRLRRTRSASRAPRTAD